MANDPSKKVKDKFTQECLDNCENLGKRMQKARRDAGWTQEDAANKLGTSPGYLSKCERNKQKIPFYLVLQYSQLFNVPFNELVKATIDPKTNDIITQLDNLLPSLPEQVVRAFHLIALEYYKRIR